MPTRREFLAVTALAPLGLLLGDRTLWAFPTGSREPAPVTPPGSGAAGALSASSLRKDGALATAAVDAARAQGASYADARLVRLDREQVDVEDDRIDRISRSSSYGIGVRVLVDGAWGFAATPRVDKANVNAAVKKAIRTAKDAAKLAKRLGAPPVELAPVEPVKGQWVAPHEVDPFSVTPADKAALLLEAAAAAMRVKGVAHVRASTSCTREEKLLVTSDGVEVHQLFFRVEPDLSATAIDRKRGRFASRAYETSPMLAGWEAVTSAKLVDAAPEVSRDALQKLHAASVKPGKRAVILAPSNLWLTIHESIGHPT
jgi:TldD protein